MYTEARPDDDWDEDDDEAEESRWLHELHDALRASRPDDRPRSTEGCVSIEDLTRAMDEAPDPALVLDTLSAPPHIQRSRLTRYRWLRSNLTIRAIVGVIGPRRMCPVSHQPRHVRPRSRPRHSPRAARGPPDGDDDPEPPRGRTGPRRAGGVL
jgi:hypothetical protein